MKLEGLKVVDLSMFLPGPLLTQMMADQGAEVIKVEPIGEGEPNRHIGPKRDGMTVYYANTHRGKKSLALNLKSAEGREILLRLAATADVMLEAFRPGVVDRLGVGYQAVSQRNPGIVYASISAFGQDGPYVGLPAHDLATEAMCGVLSFNLGQDGKPWYPAVANADMLSSLTCLSAILMALYRRKDTGRGEYIDIAMMDSLFACIPNQVGEAFANNRSIDPAKERALGGNAMYRPYETKDGRWIVLGAAEIKFAINLLTALGREDLIDLCRQPPGPAQDPVRAFFIETFKTRTQAEWVEWFAGRDISFAPVKTQVEALRDPQLRHRGMVFEDRRGWLHIGTPIKYRDEPGAPRLEFAQLGQDSDAIVADLGYDDTAREKLRAAGVYAVATHVDDS
jgi:crotonobetainyl-CoA:carnitine CoA-transferase CaiB-like acyl-CoA transferase